MTEVRISESLLLFTILTHCFDLKQNVIMTFLVYSQKLRLFSELTLIADEKTMNNLNLARYLYGKVRIF